MFFHVKAAETFYLTTREALRTITGKVNEATAPGGSAAWPDTRQANTWCRGAVLTSPPSIPHTRTLLRTGTEQVLLQSRRWTQPAASPEQRRGGKARPGCPLLPPSTPRAGPGAAAGDAPAGHRSRSAAVPITHPLASPPRVPGRPPGPTSGRVPVSAAPAGPPRPALGAAGAAGRAGGGGCRGAERRRHVTASRASPAHRRAAPAPPPPPARRRRSAEGGGAAAPGWAGPGRVYKLTRNAAGPHIKGRVPRGLPSPLARAALTPPRGGAVTRRGGGAGPRSSQRPRPGPDMAGLGMAEPASAALGTAGTAPVVGRD